ncbi:MAG TPA: S8 family peptidase [Candidatus Saccharimonadales bacterium]|nr:S8 family peptidase [Candidatus Saccharimonadales bacterium]
MNKVAPYTFEESVERLSPELRQATQELIDLPSSAKPNDKTVAAVTLHPSYTAKSYYPDALFNELGLKAIGSKETKIKPDKWTRKEEPKSVRSTTIFVEGNSQAFIDIADKISQLPPESTAAKDLVKIERVQSISQIDRIGGIDDLQNEVDLEVVLHLGDIDMHEAVLSGFQEHLGTLGINVDLEDRLQLDGICFLPLTTDVSKVQALAQFSFLRFVRPMPHMIPVIRNVPGLSFEALLPPASTKPIDPGMRVAVFDGGIPEGTAIEPWVRRFDAEGVGLPEDDLLGHGTAVTGAVLFGPLVQGVAAATPYCYVDHYRVLDGEADDDELTVIKRIRRVVENNNYSYINISLGPSIPIDDNQISPWTVILDKLLHQKGILATVATGNEGHLDEESGNARIMPPSDAVNALGVGAADHSARGLNWERAEYSSYGPGRSPGVIKPEILAFGGSSPEPFYVIDSNNGTITAPQLGTSFASPAALRTALGIRAHFGEVLSPVALKALLVHSATKDQRHETKHAGWGRVPTDFTEIVATESTSVRIVYQGTLGPAEWINVPIAMPTSQLDGFVTIDASLCYFTDTNPEDPANYTKAGMEIRFRPHSDKRKAPEQVYANSQSFFQKSQISLFEDELNYNAHFWETTLSASRRMKATGLNEPVFNLHYNARSAGGRAEPDAPPLNYAMVITISAPKNANLYQDTVARYRTQLETLQPVVQIPILAGQIGQQLHIL